MLARKGEYAFNLESGVSIEVEGEYIVFRTPEGVSRRVHFGDNPSAEAQKKSHPKGVKRNIRLHRHILEER